MKIIGLVTAFAFVLVALIGAQPAESTTRYYWNNTTILRGSVVVKYSNGDREGLDAGDATSRNIFGFKTIYAQRYYVYVLQTGTVLYNFTECDDARWITFNSQTDTSRRAMVRVTDSYC